MFIPPKLCGSTVLCSTVCLCAVPQVQWQACVHVCSAGIPGAETWATGARSPVDLTSGAVCFHTGPRNSVLRKHQQGTGFAAELAYAMFYKVLVTF